MHQDLLISVIIPVYNVENYLPQCVESVLAQTYQNLEILLVDDGSKDNGGKVCDRYAEKDSRISVIHKENGGLSSARNAGIDVARGEYLVFLDSDDWVEPDAYRSMLELALRENVKLVVAGRYDYSERTRTRTMGLCPGDQEVISAEELIRRIFSFRQCDSASCDKLYHRSLFEDIRYPLGKYYEDIPVTYRLVEKAGRAAMLNKPIYNYRHRAGSITMASLTEKTFHMEEHMEQIYPYVRDHYPAAADSAEFLLIRALRFSALTADLAKPEKRKKYRRQVRESRRKLRSHLRFLLTSPLFESLERKQDICLAFNIYRPLRKLHHRNG